MPLINREGNLISTWFANCVIVSANGAHEDAKFSITDTKFHVPVVTLSTRDNAKLLEKLKLSFKRKINWNKYQSNAKLYTARKPYLDYLIDTSFQGVNRLFILSFEDNAHRTSCNRYFLPTVEWKNYSVMINGKILISNKIIDDCNRYK